MTSVANMPRRTGLTIPATPVDKITLDIIGLSRTCLSDDPVVPQIAKTELSRIRSDVVPHVEGLQEELDKFCVQLAFAGCYEVAGIICDYVLPQDYFTYMKVYDDLEPLIVALGDEYRESFTKAEFAEYARKHARTAKLARWLYDRRLVQHDKHSDLVDRIIGAQ